MDTGGRLRSKNQPVKLDRSRCMHEGRLRSDRQGRLNTYRLPMFGFAAIGLSLASFCSEDAQGQINIPQAAVKTCEAMSGKSKPDGQALQYLSLLDQDLGDSNPVALALYREVIKQCPKDYVNYQQRKRTGNPFPPGYLVQQGSTELTKSGQASTEQSKSSQDSSHANSAEATHPLPLSRGANKGNVDNVTGAHYYYFWAGPGHIDMKMAFKEMGVLGNPFRQALSFDFYTEDGKILSHNSIVSTANLERITNSGDFGSRHRVTLAIVPQQAVIRLGGYYEIEVTGAATFDGSGAASVGVRPKSTALIHNSGVELAKSGTELYKPGQTLTIKETSKKIRLTISADVLFDFGTATVRPNAAENLQHVAALIRDKNHGTVSIEGYTDSRGKAADNMRLSQQRALAVQAWLVQNGGFTASTFSTRGFGATRPVAPNTKPDGTDDPAGRQRNRRVELAIAK